MPNVTLADMQDRVYNRLDRNDQLYPIEQVTYYINEALRVLNLFTGFLQTSVQVPTLSVANRVWYDTPSPILIPLKVQFEGVYLHKYSLTKLGQLHPRWTAENTYNTGCGVTRWTPAGLTKFGIHPADSLGGGEILVTGIQNPIPLVNATDTIQVPNEYADPLEDLAAFSIQLKEGFPLFQNAAMLYQRFLSRMKDETRWRTVVFPAYYVEKTEPK